MMTEDDDKQQPKDAEITKDQMQREQFEEVLIDTFNVTLPYEAFKSKAYRGRREKFYTIGCGNLRHPVDSKFKGRKVRGGDRIPNNEETKLKYFKSAYYELYNHISENLCMEKMNRNQLIAVNDMLYNRGPACLTRDDCCLSDSINVYLDDSSVKNGIISSLYMTAKRDGEKDMSGLRKRRNHERRLFFGDDADQIIEATDAIKTVPWKKLSRADLASLANLVAECGPDCLTVENAELPKIIKAYAANPSEQNKQKFDEEIQRSYDMKFIQRRAEKNIEIPNIRDVLPPETIYNFGIKALNSDEELQKKIEQFKIDENTMEPKATDAEYEDNKDVSLTQNKNKMSVVMQFKKNRDRSS